MASNNVIIALLFLIYQLFSSEPQCSASDLFHPLKQFVFFLEVFDLQVAVGLDAVLGQGREQPVYPKSESILLLYRLSRRQNQTIMLSASYIIIEQSSTHDRI